MTPWMRRLLLCVLVAGCFGDAPGVEDGTEDGSSSDTSSGAGSSSGGGSSDSSSTGGLGDQPLVDCPGPYCRCTTDDECFRPCTMDDHCLKEGEEPGAAFQRCDLARNVCKDYPFSPQEDGDGWYAPCQEFGYCTCTTCGSTTNGCTRGDVRGDAIDADGVLPPVTCVVTCADANECADRGMPGAACVVVESIPGYTLCTYTG